MRTWQSFPSWSSRTASSGPRPKESRKIDKSIHRLVEAMLETMADAQGVGSAANQVGVLRRVIVIQLPEEEPRVYINPEIVHREGERM